MLGWLLPAFTALILYGLWAFFPKLATSYINDRSFIIFNVIGSVAVSIIITVLRRGAIETASKGALFGILTGVAGVAGTLFFVQALAKGKAPVIITITALYPLIAIILAAIFLKESISLRQWLGMGLALIAMGLMAK